MTKHKRPTAELRREGRLTRIAKALASGATVTEIAEAEGIGRTLASREANSPECRQPRCSRNPRHDGDVPTFIFLACISTVF